MDFDLQEHLRDKNHWFWKASSFGVVLFFCPSQRFPDACAIAFQAVLPVPEIPAYKLPRGTRSIQHP
jgi:hypothetical protein